MTNDLTVSIPRAVRSFEAGTKRRRLLELGPHIRLVPIADRRTIVDRRAVWRGGRRATDRIVPAAG